MEKETDEYSHGIAASSHDVTNGNDIRNGTGNGVGGTLVCEWYVLCSIL